MKMEVQFIRCISVAFASAQTYGKGANVDVIASFGFPQPMNLLELERIFQNELNRWDHRHLGLDVTEGKLTPADLARKIKADLKALSVRLATANGWSLEV